MPTLGLHDDQREIVQKELGILKSCIDLPRDRFSMSGKKNMYIKYSSVLEIIEDNLVKISIQKKE